MPSPSFLRKLPPEERRKRASRRTRDWQERNIAAGKCQSCAKPVCRESARYCSRHLEMKRDNQRKRLGTVVHGRGKHPNTFAALRKLAEERKKKAKARIAEPASGKELA